MPRVVLVIAAVGLSLFALFDCLQTDRRSMRALPKPVWLAVIVLLPVLGPVAWLVAGRGQPPRRGPSRPVAPDDDPDFLRSLRRPPPPPPPADGSPPGSAG